MMIENNRGIGVTEFIERDYLIYWWTKQTKRTQEFTKYSSSRPLLVAALKGGLLGLAVLPVFQSIPVKYLYF